MSDYIKRENVLNAFSNAFYSGLAAKINAIPAVDAAPVVRCKDCKWWTKQEKSIQGRCALNGMYPTGGWYCANGERKDNE